MNADYSIKLSSWALTGSASGPATATRDFYPISSGILHFKFIMDYPSVTHPVSIFLGDSLNTGGALNGNRMGVFLSGSQDYSVDASNGQGSLTQLISPVDFMTSPVGIDIKFDKTLGNVFQVSINGGPYSSNISAGGDISHIDRILISNGDGGKFYLDDIRTSGNTNSLSKFIGSYVFGDSLLSDDGSNITLTKGGFFIPINGLGIDVSSAGTLFIGSTTANAIKIGRAAATTTIAGPLVANVATVNQIKSGSDCNSSATPAVCGSSITGGIVLPTGASTLVVNTTAVTAASHIFITEDSSLASRLGITCNTTAGRSYSISARTIGTSFTIKSSANPAGNKACLSYLIMN